jgi:hypothetical protein
MDCTPGPFALEGLLSVTFGNPTNRSVRWPSTSGLSDQTAVVKAAYPKLFAQAESKPLRISAEGNPASHERTKPVSELIATQVLGARHR